MARKKQSPPFSVRIPDDLRERLDVAAERNRRSVGQELLFRLEHSLDSDHEHDQPQLRKRRL
jgi:predicted transcriptional regulator